MLDLRVPCADAKLRILVRELRAPLKSMEKS